MQLFGKIEKLVQIILAVSGKTVTVNPPAAPSDSQTFTLPDISAVAGDADTLVSAKVTQTLEEKTLTTPKIDSIQEETPDAGVLVDGVKCKDSQVYTDVINEKTGDAGVTADGVLLKDSTVALEDPGAGTNKATITAPTLGGDVTITLPSATTTLVGRGTTDTLTGKTIDGDDNTLQDLGLGTLKTDLGNAYKVLQRDSSGAVAVAGTDATIVPSGNDAGRPVTPTEAMLRHNTTSKKLEIYSNSIWTEVDSVAQRMAVAKSGARYTTIQAAIDAVSDASSSKPYVISMGPGVYVEDVTLKDWVFIENGISGAVIIQGSITATGLSGTSGIRGITIEKTPTAGGQYGLSQSGGIFIIADVDIYIKGSANYAVTGASLSSGTALTIFNSTVWDRRSGDINTNFTGWSFAGSGTYGIFNSNVSARCSYTGGTHSLFSVTSTGPFTMSGGAAIFGGTGNLDGGSVRGLYVTSASSSTRFTSNLQVRLSTSSGGTAVAFCVANGSADFQHIGASVSSSGFTTNQEYLTDTGAGDTQKIWGCATNKYLPKTGSGLSIATPLDDAKTGFLEFAGAPAEGSTTFWSWAAPTITISLAGSGIVSGSPVTWAAGQSVSLTDQATNFIYMDSTGTIGATTSATETLYTNNILLLAAWRDGSSLFVSKETHPYKFDTAVRYALHELLGPLLEGTGAQLEILNASSRTLKITGTDILYDQGLYTDIPADTGPLAVNYVWVNNGTGACTLYSAAATAIPDRIDNGSSTGTITNNKYVVFRFFVTKNNLNSTAPQYFAVLPTTEYSTLAAAQAAISSGAIQTLPTEIARLDSPQIAYVICFKNPGGTFSINSVVVERQTFTARFLGSSPASSAGLITLSTTNFGGELSGAEVNVQSALDRVDDFDSLLDWATAKDYYIGNVVRVSTTTSEGFAAEWRCLTAHTSGTFTTDVNSGYWEIVANSEGSREIVNQSSHGFVAGEALYHNGTIYAKARADAAATSEVVGIVTGATTNYFVLAKTGKVTKTAWGLVAGTTYWLDPTTAGAVTATKPTTIGQFEVRIGVAPATTQLNLAIGRALPVGYVIGAASSVDNAIARFDGTGGKTIQDYTSTAPTISDAGAVTVNNTTASTTKDTGALIVEGGVGVEGSVYAGTAVSAPSVAGTTSVTTPKVTNTAGLALNAATANSVTLTVADSAIVTVSSTAVGIASGAPLTVNNTTASTTKDTGALIVEGGVGVEGSLFAGTGVTAPTVSGTTTVTTPTLAPVSANTVIDINTNAGINLPLGTIAQRPGSPAAGDFRYNSDLSQAEYYNGSQWTTTDKHSLSEIAGVEPTLDLIFDAPAALNNVTFTRATQASYYDKDGYLKLAASGVPRIDYDPSTTELKGLLLEEARTNLLTYTEHFENSFWLSPASRGSVAADVEVAPDGSYSADKFVMGTTGSTSHYIYANNVAISSSTTYTASIYVKAGEITWAALSLWEGAGTVRYGTYINLSTGALGSALTTGSPTATDRKIEAIGNGWYRISVTANLGAFTTADVELYLAEADNDITFTTGDGKSGFYLWGAQLEAGAFPTSYIPSTDTWTGRTGSSGTANATWYDASGVLQTTSGAVVRTSYNPDPARNYLASKLLLEPTRTNSFLYSEDLSNAAWTATGAAALPGTQVAAPDGATTGDTVTANATTTTVSQTFATTALAYTVSTFVKRGTFTGDVYIEDATEAGKATFTLESGTVVNTGITIASGVQALPNSWYRIWVTFLPTTSSTHTVKTIGFADSTSSKTMLYWGSQCELGGNMSSYIATTTATVKRYADSYTSASATRNRDDASMTGANFTNWYKQGEGTIYCEADSAGSSNSNQSVPVSLFQSIDTANYFQLYQMPANSDLLFYSKNGVTQASISRATNYTAGSRDKIIAAYAVNDIQCAVGGILSAADTSNLLLYPDTLHIGKSAGSARLINGHIRRLAFFPERIANAKLQAMTSLVPYSVIPSASMERAGLLPAGTIDLIPGGRPFKPSSLQIASDAITVTGMYHTLIGAGAVPAADDLATINGGVDSQLLILRAYDDAVTITVKNGTGNIFLSGSDMTLDNQYDTITLIYDGTLAKWLELARSNNGA